MESPVQAIIRQITVPSLHESLDTVGFFLGDGGYLEPKSVGDHHEAFELEGGDLIKFHWGVPWDAWVVFLKRLTADRHER
ncbi:MAG: hypothetical protein OXE77_11815 [Flavobacteriaceae bacterium]|nr:hypothetical protein [Flavobacteriaceae bacterium]MCY4267686.1 hypothetical protein [Flavobacteriaceae bacterium]MCY4297870.1 hypothetical protein [Flavobacteriaceae bacterium]